MVHMIICMRSLEDIVREVEKEVKSKGSLEDKVYAFLSDMKPHIERWLTAKMSLKDIRYMLNKVLSKPVEEVSGSDGKPKTFGEVQYGIKKTSPVTDKYLKTFLRKEGLLQKSSKKAQKSESKPESKPEVVVERKREEKREEKRGVSGNKADVMEKLSAF